MAERRGGLSRRGALAAGAAGAGLAAAPRLFAAQTSGTHDVVVVGAGAFGAWTAVQLQRRGKRVLLLDAWAPARARASSGGESRMTRGAYGADEIYTRMAWDSLAEWKRLSDRAELPLFHPIGVLFFFSRPDPYLQRSLDVHRRLGLPSEALEPAELTRRFPMIDFDGVVGAIHEPGFGALMARRGVQTLVDEFVKAGGSYRRAVVSAPHVNGRLDSVTVDGERIAAGQFVFACGPWLAKLFPDLLGRRIFPTRQEVFFFATPPGDDRFAPGRLPGWADFDAGDIFYGFPDLEGRGFKIANDKHGVAVDPDTLERRLSEAALADARAYIGRRFPALAGRPLNESRVCQYENSSNGDLLIDFHPEAGNLLLVGAGSGHGFKHAPAVGARAAALLTGETGQTEPRFSLATKAETQARDVH